jgi:hypothetical protein
MKYPAWYAHTCGYRANKVPLNFDEFVNFVSGARDVFSFLDVDVRETIAVQLA